MRLAALISRWPRILTVTNQGFSAKIALFNQRNKPCLTSISNSQATPKRRLQNKRNSSSRGVTKLIADVLGKDTTHLVVVIDEVPMANYGINGKTVKQLRSEKKA